MDHARILYVAADLSDVALVRNVLNLVASGLELESCDTLEGALQKLQRPDAYDAILVDYRLQDGDGTTFVRHVRERALSHPALVLLGTRQRMHASAALRAGADACILKQRPALARLPAAISKALMRRANGLAGLQAIRVGWVGVLSEVREELARRAPEVELVGISNDPQGIAELLGTGPANMPSIDLVVFDATKDVLDPIGVLRALRSSGLNLPIVVLTTPVSDGFEHRAAEAGASTCVSKVDGYVDRLLPLLELPPTGESSAGVGATEGTPVAEPSTESELVAFPERVDPSPDVRTKEVDRSSAPTAVSELADGETIQLVSSAAVRVQLEEAHVAFQEACQSFEQEFEVAHTTRDDAKRVYAAEQALRACARAHRDFSVLLKRSAQEDADPEEALFQRVRRAEAEVERRDTRHAIERSALEGQLRSVTDKLSQAEALVAELRGQLDVVDS